jgi:hypothetical protein
MGAAVPIRRYVVVGITVVILAALGCAMNKRHGHELRVRLLVTPGPTRVQLLVTPAGPTTRARASAAAPNSPPVADNLRFNVALLIIGDPRGVFFQSGWQAFADHVVSTISGQGHALQTFVCLPTDVEPNAKLSTQQASALHLQRLLRSNAPSQIGRVRDCFELVHKHEISHGEPFTVFIRARPDSEWFGDIPPLSSLAADAISVRARGLFRAVPAGYAPSALSHLGACSSQLQSENPKGIAETRESMHKYGIVSCVVPDDQFAVIPRKFAFAYFDRIERVRLRDGSVAVDYSANEGVQQQQRLLQSANGSSFVAAYGHQSLAAYAGVCQKYTPCWEGCAEGHLGEVLRTRQVPVQVAAFPFTTKPHEDTWTWPPRLQVQARSGDDQRTQAPLVC